MCASRAVNSAVGTPLRAGVTDVQVLISYLSPCLITIIGRIVTGEPLVAYRSSSSVSTLLIQLGQPVGSGLGEL
jgi:hypothetical protein